MIINLKSINNFTSFKDCIINTKKGQVHLLEEKKKHFLFFNWKVKLMAAINSKSQNLEFGYFSIFEIWMQKVLPSSFFAHCVDKKRIWKFLNNAVKKNEVFPNDKRELRMELGRKISEYINSLVLVKPQDQIFDKREIAQRELPIEQTEELDVSLKKNPENPTESPKEKIFTTTTITDSEGSSSELIIKMEKSDEGIKIFRACLANGTSLGSLVLKVLKDTSEYPVKGLDAFLQNVYKLENNPRLIYVNRVYSEAFHGRLNKGAKFYKGVGTELMRAAMQYSQRKNCEGRVILNAAHGAVGFYKKLDMKETPIKDDNAVWMYNET